MEHECVHILLAIVQVEVIVLLSHTVHVCTALCSENPYLHCNPSVYQKRWAATVKSARGEGEFNLTYMFWWWAETHTKTGENMQTLTERSCPDQGLRLGPSCCEATTLLTVPPHCIVSYKASKKHFHFLKRLHSQSCNYNFSINPVNYGIP